jgi:hypothetical protein
MDKQLVRDTARMFANDIVNDTGEDITHLENGRIVYAGDEMTRKEFVDELREWEHRGACTTDYFSGLLMFRDEFYIEDEYGDRVMTDLTPIVDEYFRILSTEWVVTPADRHAELARKVEQLKRAFIELNELVLHCDYSDAVETLFNSGTGCSTYPFAESFDEVTARVAYWEIGGK